MEEFCALLLLSNGTALYLHLSCRAASSAGAAFWVTISQLAVIVHTHIHGSWQEVTMHFVNDIHRMVLLYPFSDIAICMYGISYGPSHHPLLIHFIAFQPQSYSPPMICLCTDFLSVGIDWYVQYMSSPYLYLRWPTELNALHLKETDTNRQKISKLRKHLHQFDNSYTANTHNTTKHTDVLQMDKHAANTHNTSQKSAANTETDNTSVSRGHYNAEHSLDPPSSS